MPLLNRSKRSMQKSDFHQFNVYVVSNLSISLHCMGLNFSTSSMLFPSNFCPCRSFSGTKIAPSSMFFSSSFSFRHLLYLFDFKSQKTGLKFLQCSSSSLASRHSPRLGIQTRAARGFAIPSSCGGLGAFGAWPPVAAITDQVARFARHFLSAEQPKMNALKLSIQQM